MGYIFISAIILVIGAAILTGLMIWPLRRGGKKSSGERQAKSA